MARDLKAKIRLTADTKQADKALTGTAAKMGVLKKASLSLSKGMNTLKASIAASAAGLLALGVGLFKIISLANEQEDAVRKLNASLQNLDGSNEALSQSLQKQAAALAAVTTASDEQVLAVQAKIALFVKDESQIRAITKASLDFAAATGQDVVAAADLLTKTFASSTNALTRYGFEVEGAAGSTERFDSLLASLTRTQGQAEAAAGTTSGKIGLMTDAFLDATQALGGFITRSESMGSTLTFLTDLFNKSEAGLTILSKTTKEAGGAMALVAESILPKFIARMIGVEGAALRFVETEGKLNAALKIQGAASKLAAEATNGLTDAHQSAAAAANALAGEEASVTAQLEALGVVLESTVALEIQRLNLLLEAARQRFYDTGLGAAQLEAAEILVARSIDKLNLSLETQGGVLGVVSSETDDYSVSLARAVIELDGLTDAERRNADGTAEASLRRIAARASETQQRAQNATGGRSTFVTTGGGTFFIPEGSTIGPNGRVRPKTFEDVQGYQG